jgi:PKD repeat protein
VAIVAQQNPQNVIHVAAIYMSVISVSGGKAAQAKVVVVNPTNQPVSGVMVSGSWSGLVSGTSSGASSTDGSVLLTSPKTKKTDVITFTVTGITGTGYQYDPAANVETSDSISTGQAINQKPIARISASPTSGNIPLKVNFDGSASSDSDGSIIAYNWNFGDGSTGTGQTAAHTYSNAGTYQAALTVTDNLGATGSSSVTITANSNQIRVVHVDDIAMSTASVTGGAVAKAVVTIVDNNGLPITAATVSGNWTGQKNSTVSGTTGANGKVTFQSLKVKGSFTYTFTVTNLSGTNFVYDASANTETSDSISYP